MFRYTVVLVSVIVWFSSPVHVTAGGPADVPFQEPTSYEEARRLAAGTAGYRNLQRIGLALHGYHDIFGHFPSAVLFGPDGKTPYSWRVELLPVLKHYVDGSEPRKLNAKTGREEYNQLIAACGYDITQSWDSQKNRALLEAIPEVYRHPDDRPGTVEAAYYAVVGRGTAFEPNSVIRYTDIRGWPATTLMIVESRSREPWTKPVDVAYSQSSTVPRLGGFSRNGFLALTCDGAVHFVSHTVPPDMLRAFISTDMSDVFSIVGIPYEYK